MIKQSDIKKAVQAYRETATRAAEMAENAALPEPVVVQFSTFAITPQYAKERSQLIPTENVRKILARSFYTYSLLQISAKQEVRRH